MIDHAKEIVTDVIEATVSHDGKMLIAEPTLVEGFR